MRIVQAAIGVAAVLVLAGAARAEGLAVKTGLWEVSSSGGPGGGGGPGRPMPQIPADALAKLTPAQQAMVQAQMAAAAGGGAAKPIVRKMCVTQAMLEKGFAGPDDRHNCARTLVSSSASAMEFKMVCTGDQRGDPARGGGKFARPGPHGEIAGDDHPVGRLVPHRLRRPVDAQTSPGRNARR